MAAIVKSRRFLLASRGDDKSLRTMFYKRQHCHTYRPELACDAIVFYTPEDDQSVVLSLLYGAKAIHKMPVDLSLDMKWIQLYHSLSLSYPKIGIGRGAHFLNVMNGGSLWQKADGHDKKHDIKMLTSGELLMSPSNHTQVMREGNEGLVLATSKASLKLESDKEVYNCGTTDEEPEIIHYEHSNSLCVQGHPDKLGFSFFTEAFFDLVEETIASHK